MPFMNPVKPVTDITWLFKCHKCDRSCYNSIYNHVYCYCDVRNRMKLSRYNTI